MDRSKIDILCEYLNKNIAKHYPISNRELSEGTDYIKNGYLKMLAVVLQQSGNMSNAQLEMFKRIIAGAGSENSAEDYLRMALDIEIEDYVRFSDECKGLQLKYRWVLDAIILTCVRERTPEQLRLIAQFCESYDISKDEVKYIAAMAKAIVGMSASDYVTAYEIKEDSIPDVVFSDYMYLISKDCVYHNEHMTLFQPSCKEDVTHEILDKIRGINTPCIKMIGAVIELNSCKLDFSGKEKVILESCHFTGSNKNPLSFNSCEELVINNCTFEHFTTRTIILNEIDKALMQGCKFIDCKVNYESSPDESGNVIYSDRPSDIGRFDLIGSAFTDCGVVTAKTHTGYAIVSNIDSFVDNCSFSNCGCHGGWYDIDLCNELSTMFTNSSYATNCRYDNSALFNYEVKM